MATENAMEAPQREGGVQSVERALDILEFVSRSEGELGISEIGAATGLSAGTVHRLLATLGSRGYVYRNKETRRYALGLKSLTMATVTRERVGATARPFLEELAQESRETANLAILEGNSAVYIEQVAPPNRMLRIFTEPGNRVSLHACGSGKVLLAYQPPRLAELL
ncbi:MAG: IclR family transcriptional regulator, partial [Rubrobacteraceae bacterium]